MARERVVLFVLAALTLWLLHSAFHQHILVREPPNNEYIISSLDSQLLQTPEASPLVANATDDLETRHESPWGQDRHLLLYCGGNRGRFSNQVPLPSVPFVSPFFSFFFNLT
jgi:hypothetical protein